MDISDTLSSDFSMCQIQPFEPVQNCIYKSTCNGTVLLLNISISLTEEEHTDYMTHFYHNGTKLVQINMNFDNNHMQVITDQYQLVDIKNGLFKAAVIDLRRVTLQPLKNISSCDYEYRDVEPRELQTMFPELKFDSGKKTIMEIGLFRMKHKVILIRNKLIYGAAFITRNTSLVYFLIENGHKQIVDYAVESNRLNDLVRAANKLYVKEIN